MVLIAVRQGIDLTGLLGIKSLFALVNLLCNNILSLFRKEGVRHRPGGRFPAVRQGFGLNGLLAFKALFALKAFASTH